MTHWEPPPLIVIKRSPQPEYHVGFSGGRGGKSDQLFPDKTFTDLKAARSYIHGTIVRMVVNSESNQKDEDAECLARLFTIGKDEEEQILEDLFLVIRRSLKGSIR